MCQWHKSWTSHRGGGGWHKASVSDCLPLAASIGLLPLLIRTLCGPERVLVVSRGAGGLVPPKARKRNFDFTPGFRGVNLAAKLKRQISHTNLLPPPPVKQFPGAPIIVVSTVELFLVCARHSAF